MRENLNPLALSEYNTMSISDNYMYENSIFHDVYPPVAAPVSDSYSVIYEDFVKNGSGMTLEDYMAKWEETQHQTANSVIAEISQIERDEKLSPEEKLEKIQHSYLHMSQDLLDNRDEMIKLASYRADAMLWIGGNVMDSNFIKEVTQYNPGAYEMAPEMFKQRQDIIDVYRDTMFIVGPKQNPDVPERPRTPFDSIVNQNCNENRLYSHKGYKEVFTNVLLHQNQHIPYFDSTDQQLHATPAVKYLAHCETERADFVYDDIKKQAYQENRETLKKLAVHDAVVRENTAMFCYRHGIAPEPEWAKEFGQAKEQAQAALYAKLNDVANQIFTEKGTGNYPQSLIYDVRELQDKMPLEALEQRFDVSSFWQDVGHAVVDARMRMKENNYSSNDVWTRQEDRVFVNEVKETVKYNAQKALVQENVNTGIAQAKEKFQEQQRQQDEYSHLR